MAFLASDGSVSAGFRNVSVPGGLTPYTCLVHVLAHGADIIIQFLVVIKALGVEGIRLTARPLLLVELVVFHERPCSVLLHDAVCPHGFSPFREILSARL